MTVAVPIDLLERALDDMRFHAADRAIADDVAEEICNDIEQLEQLMENPLNDTQLLDKLEALMNSPTTGDGVALVPHITIRGEKRVTLLDVGDDEDVVLGRELGPSRPTLREAIATAAEPPPRPEEDDV